MKQSLPHLLLIAAAGLLVSQAFSQGARQFGDAGSEGSGPGRGRWSRDDEGRPHRPPHPPPIIRALDVDADGELSADEIALATESLMTLDEDGDGRLTGGELHPHGPPPPRGDMGAGQDGDGPRRRGRGPRGNDDDDGSQRGFRPPPPQGHDRFDVGTRPDDMERNER